MAQQFMSTTAAKAAALGILAGMRTSSALIISAYMLGNDASKSLNHTALSFMQSPKAAIAFKLMGIGELVGDKLPNTPNRIKYTALIGRCLSGALTGAAIYRAAGHKAYIGSLVGGAAAAASTFGTFFLRKACVSATKVADPYIGAFEDALVAGAGVLLVRNG